MKSGLDLETRPVIVLAHQPPFRLGTVEVRPATRELIGPERREVIEPRVMQVLVALGRAPGEILSRDDLLGCCWEGRVVGEDAINRVLSKLRKLGHGIAADGFEIETITKVGYRLVLHAGIAVEGEDPGPSPPRPRLSRRKLLVGGGALLTASAAASWLAFGRGDGVPAEAQPFYDQGLAALRAGLTENNAQAIGFLRRAAEIAPQSGEVWAALAVAYQQSRFSLPPSEAALAQERARSAVRRALALDPDNITARAATVMDMPLFGNWLTVEQAIQQLLGRDSRQWFPGSALINLLWGVGRTREALSRIESTDGAEMMLPLIQYRYQMLLWADGRLDEADRVSERNLSLMPRNYVIWFARFWLLTRTGRHQEALAQSANLAMRPPGIPDWNFELNELTARAFMTRARPDVEAALAGYRKAAPTGAGFAENAIQFAAPLGLLDEAFRVAEAYYLGRGFQVGAARFTRQHGGYTPREYRITHIMFAPTTAAMRRDPRFLPLMRKIGLVDYWRRSGTRPDKAGEMGLPP